MAETYDLGGNIFFAVSFGILLPLQIALGLKYKTWGFLFGMFSGLLLEVLGYVARVQMHFGHDKWVMYIVTLTIGPAFISAAIYLCLARIITVYGESLSRFRPRTITITFMLLDFFALLLQSAGGGIATSNDRDMLNVSLKVLQVGLSVHLVGIVIFAATSCDFAYTVYTNGHKWSVAFSALQVSRRFLLFLALLTISTLCILIRTAFRVAELSQGFDSAIANDENAFFVLDGVMVLIASICLTLCHPGPAFQHRWEEANFELRPHKKEAAYPVQP